VKRLALMAVALMAAPLAVGAAETPVPIVALTLHVQDDGRATVAPTLQFRCDDVVRCADGGGPLSLGTWDLHRREIEPLKLAAVLFGQPSDAATASPEAVARVADEKDDAAILAEFQPGRATPADGQAPALRWTRDLHLVGAAPRPDADAQPGDDGSGGRLTGAADRSLLPWPPPPH